MNMKKTIAAIAAGAMAVSAMATTVSALENKTLTYNLVKTVPKRTDGTVVLSGTVVAITGTDGTVMSVGLDTSKMSSLVTSQSAGLLKNWGYWSEYNGSTRAQKGDNGCDYESITVSFKEIGTEVDVVDSTGRATGETKIEAAGTDTIERTVNYISNMYGGDNYRESVKRGNVDFSVGPNSELKSRTQYRFNVKAVVRHQFKEISGVNESVAKGDFKIGATQGSAVTGTIISSASAFVAPAYAEAYKAPFETKASGNTEIISYLQDDTNQLLTQNATLFDNVWEEAYNTGKSYNNVRAVLNDAIANYETVEFTFNTATHGVGFFVPEFGSADWQCRPTKEKALTNALANASYVFAPAQLTYTDNVEWKYCDSTQYADMKYTNFQNQLYNGAGSWGGYYGGESGDFYGYDFMQTNLFGAALIVNENQTMSLADTDFFDFGATSITFDWDAIYANTNTVPNAYASYITTLKLMTSIDWYWDNMQVNCVLGEAEDVAAGAGAEGDEAELGDEDLDDGEGDIDLSEEEEEPADVEEEEPAEEPAEAPVVSNPGTGNAPIALAVIPVALAAAAVVAKKRG